MSAFSAFYDLLMPELPGCGRELLDVHLLDVVRDYLHSTQAWRVDFTDLDAVADQATYTLVTGVANTEVVAIHKLTVDDTLLYDTAWNEDSTGDVPQYQDREPPFTLSLDLSQIILIDDETPTAAGTDSIVISGSIRPTTSATTLPDFLRSQHSEAIRAGVFARLMAMPKKPWTNVDLAAFYLTQFNASAAFAKSEARRGRTRAPLRTRKSLF